jgi:methyl-accepting chemotaxis protein
MFREFSMQIRTKIHATFGALFLLFFSLSGFLYYKSGQMEGFAIELENRYVPALTTAFELKVSIIQVQQWLTDINATRGLDGLNDGFDEARTNFERSKSLINELIKLDPENTQHYSPLLPALENYYRVGQNMAQAYIDGGPAAGNKTMASFDSAAATMTEHISRVMTLNQEAARAHLESEREATHGLRSVTLISAILFIVLLLASGFFLLGSILKPLNDMHALAKDLAEGEGDLTKRLDAKKQDEIGTTSGFINRFVEKNQNNIQNISQIASQAEQAVRHLTDVANTTSSNANQQQQETEQIATAIHEMVATAEDVARHAMTTANETEAVKQSSQNGINTVNNAVAGIHALVSEMEQAQSVVDELGIESTNIGSVLDVIKGISEQINLLALNAAIEAARAGEQGRGFAVVAGEVRTLAGRTQTSTQEIEQMISRLRLKTSDATNVILTSAEHANDAVELVNEISQTLHEIGRNVDTISQMTVQIATAAEEQSQVSHEVDHSISRITQSAHTTVHEVETLRTTSAELNHSVGALKKLIMQFKV